MDKVNVRHIRLYIYSKQTTTVLLCLSFNTLGSIPGEGLAVADRDLLPPSGRVTEFK